MVEVFVGSARWTGVALGAFCLFSACSSESAALAAALPEAGTDAEPQADAAQEPEADVQPAVIVVEEKTIAQLQEDLSQGRATSVQLVQAYLDRIQKIDQAGHEIHAVLALNPEALNDAAALDAERKDKGPRGPLHGIPIVVKDNIESADPLPTTAGSLALQENLTHRDAPAVAGLRKAGAIVLGKTNLSEWANMRSSAPISGWSAVGGLTRNPYSLDRTACGSSSGSAAAAASSLAAAAVGTETDGSIVCPSTVNGVVGLKPTVGLVSRTYIVPISHSQDTAGPIGRTVADVAVLLTAMAGTDAADPATAEADQHKQDYTVQLTANGLQGKRLGVLKAFMGYNAELDSAFQTAIVAMKDAGATIVEISVAPKMSPIYQNEMTVLLTEFKADLNAYLAAAPSGVTTRSLADLIAFNEQNAATEMPYFAQETLEQAQATAGLDDPSYKAALQTMRKAAGLDGIDALLAQNQVDILIAPTGDPAWIIDLATGDSTSFHLDSTLSATSGYPHLTVPLALLGGLPVGISFLGPAWSEAELLAAGYAFEQKTLTRKPPTYAMSLGSANGG